MQEKWTQWKPINGLYKKYYIDSVSDSKKGFTILLSSQEDPQKKVLIDFSQSVEAYRSINESLFLETIHSLHQKYGDAFYVEWTLFKIENSDFLQWVKVQSYEISDAYNLQHFCILGIDFIVDVLTNYEPVVTHLEEKE